MIIMVVCPSQNEDDPFLLFMVSVLWLGSQLTGEPYPGSELLVTVRTQQQTLV